MLYRKPYFLVIYLKNAQDFATYRKSLKDAFACQVDTDVLISDEK
ncbi:hypothetical protein FORC066_1878 [Yersinia enterocolitica]|nr:hypothetical protein FORC065_2609 [Yersinia enterocolitica]UXD29091.1 hypothetical protein FORC066_1878 [Yersinia enterocolitica]